MSEQRTEKLSQKFDAYLLNNIQAEGIFSGDVQLILSDKLDKNISNKLVYLTSYSNKEGSEFISHGIVKIKPGYKVNLSDFKKLYPKHKITSEEKEKKWPNKEVFFAYDFKIIDKFSEPLQVKLSEDNKTILELSENIEKNTFELSKNLFKDVFVDNSFITLENNKLFINSENFIEKIKEKIIDEIPIYSNLELVEGKGTDPIYRLKLEKISNSLSDFNFINKKYYENKQNLMDCVEDEVTYVIESIPEGEEILILKQDGRLEFSKDLDIDSETVSSCLELYPENYAIKGILTENKDLLINDCLMINNKDLRDKSWGDRKSKLRQFNFKNKVNEIDSSIVDCKDSVSLAIDLRSVRDKKVAVLKYDLNYNEGEMMTVVKQEEILTCNNEGYFKTWSSEMAYYLGFITTDGHVDYENGLVEIMISKEDAEILNKLAKAIGGIRPLPINNAMRLRWRSKAMLEDLKKLGATGKKETRTVFKQVPNQYVWDFLRGMFDADGTIANKRLQMDNNSPMTQNWAYKHFKTVGGDDVKLYTYDKHWKSKQYKIVVLGEGAKKVHAKLYSGNKGLSRKRVFKGD